MGGMGLQRPSLIGRHAHATYAIVCAVCAGVTGYVIAGAGGLALGILVALAGCALGLRYYQRLIRPKR
jgi:Flp pilus assembly protein TadB